MSEGGDLDLREFRKACERWQAEVHRRVIPRPPQPMTATRTRCPVEPRPAHPQAWRHPAGSPEPGCGWGVCGADFCAAWRVFFRRCGAGVFREMNLKTLNLKNCYDRDRT